MNLNFERVYIGSDHAGYDLKEDLKRYYAQKGLKLIDLGTFSNESIDYPDIAREVSEKVLESPKSFGILICGTGIGMMMTANKYAGIRAAVCTHELMAKMARAHNDANILCLGSRIIGAELARHITDVFLETPFEEEERHVRRVGKIDNSLAGKMGGPALIVEKPEDCC